MNTYQQIKNPHSNRYIYVHGTTYNTLVTKYGQKEIDQWEHKFTHKEPKSPQIKSRSKIQTKQNNIKIDYYELPNDILLNDMMKALDFKTLYAYCKTNKAINNQCKSLFIKKLEEEIQVPLTHYSAEQINKIAKEVINGSFRQDILLGNQINLINEDGFLVKLGSPGDVIMDQHHLIKMAKNIKWDTRLNMQTQGLLLLDNHGKVWTDDFDKPLDLPYIIDISYYKGKRFLFVVAITVNGEIYAKVAEDPIDHETKFSLIGEIPGARKAAVGQNHCVVLTDKGDLWFFSQNYYFQVPVTMVKTIGSEDMKNQDKIQQIMEDQRGSLINFTLIRKNVKQVCINEDDGTTMCLTDESIIYYTPGWGEERSVKYDNHIIYFQINKDNTLLLDDQGNLYQLNSFLISRYDELSQFKIASNVCNVAIGDMQDIVFINPDGLNWMGNKNWKGGWSCMPETVPQLYEKYQF